MTVNDSKDTPREAQLSDASGLDIIRRQAIEDRFSDHYDRSQFADRVAEYDTSIEQWIESPDVDVLMLETSMTPVCYGVYDRETSRIRALYTSPDYQGRGCAGRVLEEIIRRARELGRSRIQAWVPRPSVDYFRGREFEVVEQCTRGGLEGAEMVLRLTG